MSAPASLLELLQEARRTLPELRIATRAPGLGGADAAAAMVQAASYLRQLDATLAAGPAALDEFRTARRRASDRGLGPPRDGLERVPAWQFPEADRANLLLAVNLFDGRT